MTNEEKPHNPKGAGRKRGPMPKNAKGQALTKAGKVAKVWQPGVSGNADGPKAPMLKIRDAARAHGPEAIETLVEIMRGQPKKMNGGVNKGKVINQSKDSDRIRAAEILLDRGYGKAPAKIDINDDRPAVKDQTHDELTRAVTNSLEAIARLFSASGDQGNVVEGTCEELPNTVHTIPEA